MIKPDSGLRHAGLRAGLLAGVYLSLVLLIVTLEVVWGYTPLLAWAFLLCSLVFLFGAFYFCFKGIRKKHVALPAALITVLLGLLAALVIGVNFKFLIGGSL